MYSPKEHRSIHDQDPIKAGVYYHLQNTLKTMCLIQSGESQEGSALNLNWPLAILLGLATILVMGWPYPNVTAAAQTGGNVYALTSPEGEDNSPEIQLHDVHSFEVNQFHGTFDLETRHVAPELIEYVQSALHESKVLPFTSPAEGRIELDCAGRAFGHSCGKVKLTVLAGKDQQVIWETTVKRYHFTDMEIDERKVAQTLIHELEKAYQASIPKE